MSAGSPAGGVARVCPLFVGRDDMMALVLRRRAEAAAGRGELLLVGGEAGIGKSRLLDELVVQAGGRSARADSFAGDRDTPGLLLLGIAAALRAVEEPGPAERVRALVVGAGGVDSEGARRILVADLAATLIEALSTPLLLRLEDLHWADQLSLDALQRVAVGLPSVPSLVVASYRSEEPDAAREFTAWRLGLLAQRRAEEVVLTRLDRDGTRRMLASITGEEPSADQVDRLFDAADGIPLHVEELVAVGVDAVPDTIGGAVLVRMARLGSDAALTVAAAAVIGREFDRRTLDAVLGGDADVDGGLEELIAANFIVPAGDRFDFRHALIRDAVYGSVPAARRRELHARVVEAAPQLSDAVLSTHFERAGRADEAYVRARRAAGRAAALSAHREAVDLYRRAERTVPSGTPVAERAELHRLLGAELAAADANVEAEREFSRAIELLRESGDQIDAAAVVPALVNARHLLGVGYEARAAQLGDALTWIVGADGSDSAARRVRGRLLAAHAAAAMLDRRLDLSLRLTAEARELLTDDPEERLAVDVTRGSVLVFAGAGEEGWQLLLDSATAAASHEWEAAAARAYRMIGSSASVLLQYHRGRSWLEEGISYATRIERWNDAHYLDAHLAHVEWATGSLDAAEQRAGRARADGRGGITTEVTALHVLGYVALSRGDTSRAAGLLGEAAAIGERMRELQRWSPPLWGLAEVALADGDAERAVELCDRGLHGSEAIEDAAYLFPYLVTGTRAQLLRSDVTAARDWVERAGALVRSRAIPGTENAIAHAEGLVALAERRPTRAKELLAAAGHGWSELGRWWEGTQVLLDRAECARRTRGPAEAAALTEKARARATEVGAGALVARADALAARLDDGAETTVLSSREREVARLVASGATNREIGESLHIAPKTVSTHVEHILAKLGAARRTEIAAWAVEDARRGSAP
ncbi:LuxR C-terminal-related transcriptional regulator [Leifsonia sp. 2TAF2]|uniref:helix-turn-helix transcriptional regulator n=1 Tax=Leifsonia sp. 2TAF2 TaxID=3233009 RepID=UPI003F99BFAF